jgi:hypothetical protein
MPAALPGWARRPAGDSHSSARSGPPAAPAGDDAALCGGLDPHERGPLLETAPTAVVAAAVPGAAEATAVAAAGWEEEEEEGRKGCAITDGMVTDEDDMGP